MDFTFVVNKSIATSFRSEEHTSELQSRFDLVCRLLLSTPRALHSICTLSLHDALPILKMRFQQVYLNLMTCQFHKSHFDINQYYDRLYLSFQHWLQMLGLFLKWISLLLSINRSLHRFGHPLE